jgi:hypothetical protein
VATFFRAALAAAVAACALLVSAGSAVAYNPDNNGHHYGWYNSNGHHYGLLKHHLLPPPAPVPGPAPAPAPKPKPKPHPSTGGTAGLITSSGQPGEDLPQNSDIPLVLPPVPEVLAPQVKVVASVPGDPLDWLVLVILPALLAIWLLIFARAALAAARRRPKAEAA